MTINGRAATKEKDEDATAPRRARPSERSRSTHGGSRKLAGFAIPLWLPLGGLLLISAAETGRIDGPHRELFFNIDYFWVLYALLPIVIFTRVSVPRNCWRSCVSRPSRNRRSSS